MAKLPIDASCPWWQEIAVVYGSREDALQIEDSLCSYCDSTECGDKDYGEMVVDVLNASGLKWEKVNKIPIVKDDGISFDMTTGENVIYLSNFSCDSFHCDNCGTDIYIGDIDDFIQYGTTEGDV